ncbi:glycoside hydrolase [Sordaria brevicollis]|uniref:Probable beta-glucosidase btgE n=1 Tax=Sordaria brevicollis TaxID=83679 RepID=A0AAE0PDB5_SORBR|nr:glycoside hydrolase [Sordaria brevicollis]
MKGTIVAAAALLAGGASANRLHHRHLHQPLFEKRVHNESEICVPGCTTIWTTITGPAGLYTPPAPPSTAVPATSSAITTSEALPTLSSSLVFANTSSIAVPSTTEVPVVIPTTTSQGPITVPTPIQQTCPTPGTYTFPATTVVLTETKTVCGASSTVVPSGTHTLGGVTTVVETATTVVCPVATTKTAEDGVVTSVVEMTTYVCPSAGTYTIAPITTTVTDSEPVTVVVPVVETYCPGTYSAPAVVTTVTETNVVVYCPFTTVEPPVPTTQAPEPTTAVAPPPVVTEVPQEPTTTSSSSTPAPTGNLGGKGDKWAMTYTPFTQEGQCKNAADVMTDIKAIAKAGFTTLRVYSTDCDTLPSVGAAAEATGLRLILGIFIGTVGCENGSPDVSEQIAAIKNWGRFDMVDLVVVGNEALFNGFCSVGQLTDLIHHVKSELGSAGYSGPYTTTDVVSAWQANDVSSICNAIDVVACNAHAYFNANTAPEQAGTFVAGQLEIVEKICNKPGFVMETGWPTAGECIGKACPGREQQRTALAAIKQELGKKVVFFSFTDDHWKQPGACNCEQHWGCGDVFGAAI